MYINFFLKTIDGRDTGPNFAAFAVWSTLIVGGWVVLAWSRSWERGDCRRVTLVLSSILDEHVVREIVSKIQFQVSI